MEEKVLCKYAKCKRSVLLIAHLCILQKKQDSLFWMPKKECFTTFCKDFSSKAISLLSNTTEY